MLFRSAGFKIGDALSAATQATEGLVAAQGQVSQGFASAIGKLPAGTDLNSLTASLGTTGAAAAGQLSSALQGSIPAISSQITAASSALTSCTLPIPQQDVWACWNYELSRCRRMRA